MRWGTRGVVLLTVALGCASTAQPVGPGIDRAAPDEPPPLAERSTPAEIPSADPTPSSEATAAGPASASADEPVTWPLPPTATTSEPVASTEPPEGASTAEPAAPAAPAEPQPALPAKTPAAAAPALPPVTCDDCKRGREVCCVTYDFRTKTHEASCEELATEPENAPRWYRASQTCSSGSAWLCTSSAQCGKGQLCGIRDVNNQSIASCMSFLDFRGAMASEPCRKWSCRTPLSVCKTPYDSDTFPTAVLSRDQKVIGHCGEAPRKIGATCGTTRCAGDKPICCVRDGKTSCETRATCPGPEPGSGSGSWTHGAWECTRHRDCFGGRKCCAVQRFPWSTCDFNCADPQGDPGLCERDAECPRGGPFAGKCRPSSDSDTTPPGVKFCE